MPTPYIEDLLSYLDKSVTAFHAVQTSRDVLLANGFTEVFEDEDWSMSLQGKYFVVRADSALAAWQIGSGKQEGVRLIGAHTDSPGLHLKPRASYGKSGYLQLGVEVYGGPLLASWTDRDLSLAGKLVVRDGGKLKVRGYRSARTLLRVPQLAIHLNREVNDKGLLLNKQQHLPPIAGLLEDDQEIMDESILKKMIADDLGLEPTAIQSWKLECFDTQPASLSGLRQEFIVSGRIDNLTMCHAALTALIEQEHALPQTAMIALFDNEEIGSSTSNGAASSFVRDIMNRLLGQHASPSDLPRALSQSFCISADGAHAVHPNYAEYHDPQHAVKMNRGPVIKVNANHRYATDPMTAAVFENLCEDVKVPVQHYIHKTDLPCGSTIGPITATGLGIPVVDVGNAMLSMHSIRETCGAEDHGHMIRVLSQYFRKEDIYAVL